jgi:hypothetical protein
MVDGAKHQHYHIDSIPKSDKYLYHHPRMDSAHHLYSVSQERAYRFTVGTSAAFSVHHDIATAPGASNQHMVILDRTFPVIPASNSLRCWLIDIRSSYYYCNNNIQESRNSIYYADSSPLPWWRENTKAVCPGGNEHINLILLAPARSTSFANWRSSRDSRFYSHQYWWKWRLAKYSGIQRRRWLTD